MRYLCLIYDDEKKVAAMPEGESNAFMGEYFAFTDGIKQSGHYLGGEALQPVQTATTVRVRNGKMSARPTARSPRPRSSSAAST